MLSNILIAPSLNSLFITGILLSTITIAIGIHGLIHLGTEIHYNFNPYNWF